MRQPYTFSETDDDGAVLFQFDCEIESTVLHGGPDPEVLITAVLIDRSRLIPGKGWVKDGYTDLLTSPVEHLQKLAVRIVAAVNADEDFLAARWEEETFDMEAA